MKKILFLTALAATSFSSVAMAGVCASQTDYAVTVGGLPAGTATFAKTTITGSTQTGFYGAQSTCGYTMAWKGPVADDGSDPDPETSCSIAQSSFGQGSCDAGSQAQPTSSFSAPTTAVAAGGALAASSSHSIRSSLLRKRSWEAKRATRA